LRLSQLRSLGLKTDIEIARFENKLTERDGYLVVETPGNPDFYWGNFLLFPSPPTLEDRERWPAIFQKEFSHNPAIQHRAFTWDSPEGERGADFPGYQFESSPIYHLNKATRPPRMNEEVEVRQLSSGEDWQQALHNQVSCRAQGFEEAGYLRFKERQMARYLRMSEKGLGHWYGAFLHGKLVADAGLFHFGEIARFQSVGTAPAHRRQGIATALIYNMAQQGLKRSKTLVIVADPTEGADRVYRSVGFGGDEISVQLTLRAPRDQ
jgi:ribosomal protein S18 acetylase RimI-like enzyme